MIRAVVIDVDDTLCLTEAVCFELENEVLERLGRRPMQRSVHVATWGQPLLPAMLVRSPGIDIDEFSKVYAQALRVSVEAGKIDTIAEENLQAIDELAAAGREIMLLTSREEDEVAHFLAEEHVLAGRVSAVFHAGSTTYLKPDPRAFDVVLRRTALHAQECVYVGDSPGDAVAAHGAGMWFIGCLQSRLRSRKEFDAAKVHAYIEDFPEIVGVVGALDDTSGRSR